MRRRDKAGGKAVKTQRPKTLKRRNAPKTARRRSSLAAGKANKRRAAHPRARRGAGAAGGDLGGAEGHQLSSPGELEPVFNAMLENATRICEAKFGTCFSARDDGFRTVAVHGAQARRLCAHRPVIDLRHPGIPARTRRPNKTGHPCCRPADDPSISAEQPSSLLLVDIAGARTLSRGADAQGGRTDRRHYHLSPGGAAVHRQADRAGDRISPRRPSSPSRTRGCSTNCAKSLAAANRHRRCAQGHQPLDFRPADGARHAWSSPQRACAVQRWQTFGGLGTVPIASRQAMGSLLDTRNP